MSESWTVLSNFSLPERSMLRRSERYGRLVPACPSSSSPVSAGQPIGDGNGKRVLAVMLSQM